ncbi:MAG: PstS family phosphate ABC transporter substrate-binding protein [Deltaproteobacteria bacterium]|nr:PstS family phosphate ABC transporter substrate-binding protein [Deltaproteobacteria bacterium]
MRWFLSCPARVAFLGVLLLTFSSAVPARGGTGDGPPPRAQLMISGSGWTGFLVKAWARTYEADHPDVRVKVRGSGTNSGISAILSGQAEIAYDQRPLKSSEFRDARERGIVLAEYPVALDGIAVVINPANPAVQATKAVVAGIFAGDLDQWADLGGPRHKISIYCQRPGSQAGVLFQAVVLGKRKPAEACQVAAGPEALLRALEKDPYGIGYVRLSDVKGKEVKVLPIGQGKGKAPLNPMRSGGNWINQAIVSAGEYPLTRTIYLHAARQPRGNVKQFLDWILGPAGQLLLVKEGYIPLPGQLPAPPPDAFH